MSKNNPKILIVRLSAIGDTVHSLPLVHALRQKYDNAFIGWAVEDKAADMVINNPAIDKVHIFPKKAVKANGFSLKSLKLFNNFVKEIKEEKYDIAIDLQELFKSGLITYLSGAKRRIAHAKTREFAEIFVNEKLKAHDIFDPNRPVIDRYLEPARYLGASTEQVKFPIPDVSEKTKSHVDELFKEIDPKKPVIVFSPATIWPSKHWIEKYWSELLDMLAENNNIIFTGAPADRELVQRITTGAKTEHYFSFIGKTDIIDLLEIYKRTDVIIAPDTGPAHIANAAQKPYIICLFGPTSSKRSGPYGSEHVSLSSQLDCQPCFKRSCSRNKEMECMYAITPEMVFEQVNKKLMLLRGSVV